MKYYYLVSPTPLEKLGDEFVPAYQQFVEYAKITTLFIAIAGVMSAVIKSSRK